MKKQHILIMSALILSFAQPVFADNTATGELEGIGSYSAGMPQCNKQKSIAPASSMPSIVNTNDVNTAGNGNG
jgi:hypothetical protein